MFKPRSLQFITLFLPCLCFFFMNSCAQNTDPSETELIKKINAVHKQIMVQGNISEQERQALVSLASLVGTEEDFSSSAGVKGLIEFKDVAHVPVYPGCEALSPEASRQCFLEKVNELVKTQFNTDIPKDLGIQEEQQVEVFFKIDEKGEISHRKVREANVVIQAEIVRVIKQLPVMKPAVQDGEAVAVMFSTVISYGGS